MALLYLFDGALRDRHQFIGGALGDCAEFFDKAFDFQAAAGGLIGAAMAQAMMLGIKRGLFSNEAGMGSAPNAGGPRPM